MARVKSTRKAEVVEARPRGRPTLYKPEFCERVVELGALGKSPVQIAVALGVLRENLYDWAERHPDFSTAIKKAKMAEQDWWETQGAENLNKAPFQAQVWRTSMQARFRDDYTERRVTELTGANGGPLAIEHRRVIELKDLPSEQRQLLRQALVGLKAKEIEHE